jgi:hypothetical protein
MLVYVVCAEVPFDSYHSLVLVTLDKSEADKTVNGFNAEHEPDCRTQRVTWSDYDECFCRRYHMHSVSVKGIMPRIRGILQEMNDTRLVTDLSVSS